MSSAGRDYLDRLLCPVATCKTTIDAMTGLQELQKLMTHMKKKHKTSINMDIAMKFREMVEKGVRINVP